MRFLLAIVSALIAYGSLYPFAFAAPSGHALREIAALPYNPFATARGDLIANIALFVPFGFFGVLSLPRLAPRLSLPIVIATGAVFAFLLQLGQIFVPPRDPSLIDVVWNIAGVSLGSALALLPWAHSLATARGPWTLEPPSLLALFWIASQWMPLVPSLDLKRIEQGLKPLIMTSRILPVEIMVQASAWLVALHLMSRAKLPKEWQSFLPALPLLVLALQPFIVRNGLTIDEVSGAVAGLALWLAARSLLSARVLAGVLVIAILATSLMPFGGVQDMAGLLEKAFLYGALLWLSKEAGLRLSMAILLALAVAAIGVAPQILLTGGVPLPADPVLVLLLAWALRVTAERRPEAVTA
jgi:VanZ family protein